MMDRPPGARARRQVRKSLYYEQYELYLHSINEIRNGVVNPKEDLVKMRKILKPMAHLVAKYTKLFERDVLDEAHARAILQLTMDTGFMEQPQWWDVGYLPNVVRIWEWRSEAYQLGVRIQNGEEIVGLDGNTSLFSFIAAQHQERLKALGNIRHAIITAEARERTRASQS